MPKLSPVCFLTAALLAGWCSAATYYVSPGGSDGNPGDLARPFKTLAKAGSVANVGDTFFFRAGTYTGTLQLSRSGTAASPITFKNYPGEQPIFDAQVTDYKAVGYNIGPLYVNYVVFEGLELTNASENILLWGGHHRTIRNCVIHTAQLNCVQFHNGAHDDLIENCRIYDWNLKGLAIPASEWSENYGIHCIQNGTNYTQAITIRNNEIFMATPTPSVMAAASRWAGMMIENAHATVIANRIHDIQDAAICIWRPVENLDYTVTDNVLYNMQGYAIAMDINGRATRSLNVSRNLMHDVVTGDPNRWDINALRIRGAISGGLCANNLVFSLRSGHHGIRLDSGDNNSKSVNIQLLNNTVIGGDNAFSIVQGSTGIMLSCNIAKGVLKDVDISADSGVTSNKNLLCGPGSTVKPQFVNAAAYDYRLCPTSPAIDAAAAVSTALKDLAGNDPYDVPTVANTGTGPVTYRDIGCYEYVPGTILPGDANGDGAVDVGDLGILGANYGKTTGMTWASGDFTGNGAVDVGDLGILGANYGRTQSMAQ